MEALLRHRGCRRLHGRLARYRDRSYQAPSTFDAPSHAASGKVVKPKPKEAPISDQARLLGTGTVGSGGGKIKLMHNKDCVIGVCGVRGRACVEGV